MKTEAAQETYVRSLANELGMPMLTLLYTFVKEPMRDMAAGDITNPDCSHTVAGIASAFQRNIISEQ